MGRNWGGARPPSGLQLALVLLPLELLLQFADGVSQRRGLGPGRAESAARAGAGGAGGEGSGAGAGVGPCWNAASRIATWLSVGSFGSMSHLSKGPGDRALREEPARGVPGANRCPGSRGTLHSPCQAYRTPALRAGGVRCPERGPGSACSPSATSTNSTSRTGPVGEAACLRQGPAPSAGFHAPGAGSGYPAACHASGGLTPAAAAACARACPGRRRRRPPPPR